MMTRELFRSVTSVLSDKVRERFLAETVNIDTEDKFLAMSEDDLLIASVFNQLVACCGSTVATSELLRIIKAMVSDLRYMYKKLSDGGRFLPTYMCIISEQQFVTWTGANNWICIESGKTVIELPQPPVLTINCMITTMYLRNRKKLDEQNSKRVSHATKTAL